jgi:hypothetical protein
MTEDKPIDRFLIAAVTDRLIFDSETVFDPADARILLDALPHRKTRTWGFGMSGKLPGGTTEGFAAGVGSTNVEDEKERSFSFGMRQDSWTRAGQWKLKWSRKRGMQTVEIQQVMADETDEGKGARIHYAADGTPTAMDIQAARSLGLLNIEVVVPRWQPWKRPASA